MRLQMRYAVMAWLLFLCAIPSQARAQPLTIAAASDLQGVMPEVVVAFEKTTGKQARIVFGSSGNFFTQITNGAPFDLFFSADIDYPRRLAQAGLTTPGTLYEYATGRLVLWSLKGAPIDLSQGLRGLLAPAVRRVAIANPEHAPYGRAAVAALRHAGIYDQVRPKLVMGENISQAAQFVQSGNAEAGILALSVTRIPAIAALGQSVPLPLASYPPITQAAVILSASRQQEAAEAFLDVFKTAAVGALLKQFGFEAPGSPVR